MRMKILALALLGAGSLFGETLLQIAQPADFVQKNRVGKTADALTIKGKSVIVYSRKAVKVDPAKKYRLSMDVRYPGEPVNSLFTGFVPFAKNGRLITSASINTYANSGTELAEDAKAGDTVLKLKNAQKWLNSTPSSGIAFNVKDDFSDLPNYEVLLIKKGSIRKAGEVWELELVKPLTKAYPAGCKVRQHIYAGTYLYSKIARKLDAKNWVNVSGEITGIQKCTRSDKTFWPATDSVRVLIMTSSSSPESVLEVKNIKLEEVK